MIRMYPLKGGCLWSRFPVFVSWVSSAQAPGFSLPEAAQDVQLFALGYQ
jgi:hypothetical protein